MPEPTVPAPGPAPDSGAIERIFGMTEAEIKDVLAERVREITAARETRPNQPAPGSNEEREAFIDDLAMHLLGDMEQLGLDVDLSDGRVLADTVYCLGYRKVVATPDGADS